MNLIYHLDYSEEPIPTEISKKVVLNSISPIVTVTSSPEIDQHVQESYGLDSLYMLLRYFGDCITDRDQAEEDVATSGRPRSNSLFQREVSQFIRFTRPLPDLIGTRDTHDLLFDYHSLEVFLKKYLELVEIRTTSDTPHRLLRHSTYHKFFTTAISSTAHLSPYESFNHPVVSLLAIDISKNQTYENARDLLIAFKNMHNQLPNFPNFININDILPVFLLCYDENSREQFETCQSLTKMLKKQLFVESILLPLWNYQSSAKKVVLHQPIMSSLEETMLSMMNDTTFELPLQLANTIYDRVSILTNDLMIPFMKRKISFWEETILQPRKSIFQNSKFFRRLITKSAPSLNEGNSITHNNYGLAYFPATSNEFLMRKLADWSFMISDFKTAYSTYELLSRDLDSNPEYLAPCLEWCALAVLMGAQSIVTVKMIKNDIDPLITRALKTYELCANRAREKKSLVVKTSKSANTSPVLRQGREKSPTEIIAYDDDAQSMTAPSQSAQSYETRCMLLAAELFLSLSDTWTSTPYAIKYLETILDECAIGPLSEVLIWERLAYCYALRIDPRTRGRKTPSDVISSSDPEKTARPENVGDVKEESSDDDNSCDDNYKLPKYDVASVGLSRRRKSTLFELIAAKKWSESNQWRRSYWSFKDVEQMYGNLEFANRKNLILERLKMEIQEHEKIHM